MSEVALFFFLKKCTQFYGIWERGGGDHPTHFVQECLPKILHV